MEKARGYFDEALSKLRLRMLHVMARLCALADDLMLIEASRTSAAHSSLPSLGTEFADEAFAAPPPSFLAVTGHPRLSVLLSSLGALDEATPARPAVHAHHMAIITPVFHQFVARTMASTMEQSVCVDRPC